MADDIATITFSNDQLTDANGNPATLTGSVQVDYTTRSFSGSYRLVGSGSSASVATGGDFSSAGGLVQNGNAFTLSAANLTVNYTGEYPGSADSIVYNNPGTPVAGFGNVGALRYAGTNQPLSTVACYVEGTGIRTPDGDRPVETLAIGDMVVTASGEHRAIRWIGRRGYSGRFARNNPDVLPVCFKAGSLGPDTPYRDLWVSPKHAMFVDEVLVPAECLVNGTTIVRAARVDEVRYFHVELDTHDVLLAEGAPSESFVDDDSVGMFVNAAERDAPTKAATYCARRVESGYELEAIRRRLASVLTAAA